MIVLGDFNDEPRAATGQLLLGPDDADASAADTLDGFRLYNLVDAVPMRGGASHDQRFVAADAYSRVFEGRRELIDHILVGKSLLGTDAELHAGRLRVKEVRILVEAIEGTSVGADPGARVGSVRPDHAPVFARFEW
jgi:endonuclease/exonuclease/phosphatase family metal-dependent hydrolase